MGSSISSASVCSGILCALIALTAPARADDATTDACVKSHIDGQKLALSGKLMDARKAFLSCAATTCPVIVKDGCASKLAEVEKRIPSIVLDVRDGENRDLSNVKVSVDAEVLSETLEGRSIPLDPGSHRFRFEAAGFRTLERTYVLREGEHSRRIDVKLESDKTREPRATPKTPSTSKGLPWTFWALGGVGVLGLGAGSYFFFDGRSDVSALRDSCAPSCAESDVDDARRKIRTADVFLGVGVVALGVATVIALTHDSPKETVSRRTVVTWPSF
jgi:hypothetical protein